MSDIRKLDNIIYRISTAYIYNSLYINGFLKSKPITLGTGRKDISNKIMNTIKSSINAIAKDRHDAITNVRFSYSYLYVTLNNYNISHQVKRRVLHGYVKLLSAGLTDSVAEKVSVSINSNSLTFVMNSIIKYRNNASDYAGLKDDLDNTVTAIIAVPNIVKEIISFIDEDIINLFERPKTVYDLYLIWKGYNFMDNFAYVAGFNVNDLKEYELPPEMNEEYLLSMCPYYGYNTSLTEDIRTLLLANNQIVEITEEEIDE